MNTIAVHKIIDAHKDELEKLLEHLSNDRVVSGITFVALVNAYITGLDTNCPDVSARANPPPAQIAPELTYGINIDSNLRALLRATQNCKTARRVLPKGSAVRPASKHLIFTGGCRQAKIPAV